MKYFRLNVRVVILASATLNLLLTLFFSWWLRQPVTEYELWGLGVHTVLLVILLADSVLANFYLGIITTLHPDLDKQTLFALKDAWAFRLRKLAIAADEQMMKMVAQLDDLLKKAGQHPALLKDASFLKAAYGFRFENAEAILKRTIRAAEYAAEQEKKRAARQETKMVKLLLEAEALGLSADETSHLAQAALRDLVERTRKKLDLQVRAAAFGCVSFIEQCIKEERFEEAEKFLIRAHELLKFAQLYKVEGEAREMVSYGKLEGVEKLLRQKYGEAELHTLKVRALAQVEQLPEHNQARVRELLDAACSKPYGSREFNKAFHEFDKALKDAG